MLGDGRVTHLPGGIEEYLDRLPTGTPPVPAQGRPVTLSDAAEQRNARKALARLERRLDTLHSRVTALNEAMAGAGPDTDRLVELDAQLRAVRTERDEVEQEWLEAAERAGA
jgi:ATP-binding cassette subfamily F protein uup